MLDLSLAREIAQRWLDAKWTPGAPGMVICDGLTRERPFGWVFCYQSERYLQTKDPQHKLTSNGPLMVDRADGSVHVMGTAKSIDEYIHEYERHRQTKP